MDNIRHQFSVSDTITSQFISHDLSGFATMPSQQSFEEAFSCSAIRLCLQENVTDFPALIHGSPEVMLFAIYLYDLSLRRRHR
jgi:hypothetical protein